MEKSPVIITSPAELPRVLRKIRLERKLPLKTVAEMAGCSVPSVSAYERGERTPRVPTMFKVAEALDYEVQIHLVPKSVN